MLCAFHLFTYLCEVHWASFFSSMIHTNYGFCLLTFYTIPSTSCRFLLFPLSTLFSFVFLHCFPDLSFLFLVWVFFSSSPVSASSLRHQNPDHPQKPLFLDTAIFLCVGFVVVVPVCWLHSCSVREKDYFRFPLIKWKRDDMSKMWKAHW